AVASRRRYEAREPRPGWLGAAPGGTSGAPYEPVSASEAPRAREPAYEGSPPDRDARPDPRMVRVRPADAPVPRYEHAPTADGPPLRYVERLPAAVPPPGAVNAPVPYGGAPRSESMPPAGMVRAP